jgi:hypothetical protein
MAVVVAKVVLLQIERTKKRGRYNRGKQSNYDAK